MSQLKIDEYSVEGIGAIPSASTVDLENATGDLLDISGTTTITRIILYSGHKRIVRFTGVLTLTNSSTLVLPGGANITTAAGDFATFVGYVDGTVRCVVYSPIAGSGGSGNVVGPASATNGNLAVFSGTTGKIIADGGAVPAGAAIGSTVTGATAGSVLFAGAAGVLAQDNANFFYDSTTKQLIFGDASGNNWSSIGNMAVGSNYCLGIKNRFTGNAYAVLFNSTAAQAVRAGNLFQIGWSSGAAGDGGDMDTGLIRNAAGVIRVTAGGAGAGIRGFLGGGTAVASATAMPLPTGRVFHVTGTTNITSITSTNFASGAVITLIFDDVLTFTDGSNLKLAGNFVTTADDTITLSYDGTNWYEVCRSVN